jgi:hypothetical protein
VNATTSANGKPTAMPDWPAVLSQCRARAGRRPIDTPTAQAIANHFARGDTPAMWECSRGRLFTIATIDDEIARVFADAEHARLALGMLMEWVHTHSSDPR